MMIKIEAGRGPGCELMVGRGCVFVRFGKREWFAERLLGGWYVNGARVGR